MNVNYHAPFSINEYFKNQIAEKLEKLDDLQLRFSEADVYFKLKDGAISNEDKEFEVKVHVPGHILFSKSHADTFEKAIPLAFSKIRKQIIKYKQSLEPKRGIKV